jgi:hypothetical protein
MSSEMKNESNKIYFSVFDQKFRTRVPEGSDDALSRINKLGKQVHEREVSALFGVIEDLAIEDSDYGKQLKITLDKNDDGKNPVITFGVESKNGRDVLKLLPAVDFSKEVRILPYRFTPDDKDEEVSGISIAHKDDEGKFTKKVGNYYYDPIAKKYLHGYPVLADWDKATESEQKIYKIQRDEFLLEETKKLIEKSFSEKTTTYEYPKDELDPKDIPFD